MHDQVIYEFLKDFFKLNRFFYSNFSFFLFFNWIDNFNGHLYDIFIITFFKSFLIYFFNYQNFRGCFYVFCFLFFFNLNFIQNQNGQFR